MPDIGILPLIPTNKRNLVVTFWESGILRGRPGRDEKAENYVVILWSWYYLPSKDEIAYSM